MAKQKALICPYCGRIQPETDQCRACHGFLDPLSRQATHNAMGPWFLREEGRDFHPGCGYEMIVKLIERGQLTRHTIIRGPTTKQFWTIAKRVPCVSHLLGYCHNCDASVDPQDHGCHACGVPFGAYLDRNYLGLPEVRPLPWEADVDDGSNASVGPRIDVPEEMRREWVRAPGTHRMGGKISSFAPDDELRAASAHQRDMDLGDQTNAHYTDAESDDEMQMDAPATSIGTATSPQTTTSPARSEAAIGQEQPESTDPLTVGIATRSLQRRLLHNTRVTQRLTIVLFISVAANVLVMIGLFAGWFGNSDTNVQQQPASAESQSTMPPRDATAATNDEDEVQRAEDQSEVGKATDGSEDEPEQPSPSAPADAIEIDEAAGAMDQPDETSKILEDGLGEVANLIEAAQDEMREIEDRIADYSAAIARLQELLHGVPAALAMEHELQDRITEYQRARERLRLRAFFP